MSGVPLLRNPAVAEFCSQTVRQRLILPFNPHPQGDILVLHLKEQE